MKMTKQQTAARAILRYLFLDENKIAFLACITTRPLSWGFNFSVVAALGLATTPQLVTLRPLTANRRALPRWRLAAYLQTIMLAEGIKELRSEGGT